MKRSADEPRKSAGRPRSMETDEAILVTTLRHLAEHGYARMSLDAIAAEASTTKPTIYRRWSGKEELAIAALGRYQVHEQPRPTGFTEDDLVSLLRDFQRKLLRPNGMAMIGTLLAEEQHTPKLIRLFRDTIVKPRRDGLLAILKAARDRGELHADADLDAAVNLLVGSFYARYLSGEGVPQDWPVRVVRMMLAALRVDAQHESSSR
ncbi:MAG: TetR/AcrR family transcriptional regulator [Isosphaeraceae bacterium]